MKMQRRTYVLGSLSALGLAAVGLPVLYRAYDEREPIFAVLEKHLGNLRIDRLSLEKFVSDYTSDPERGVGDYRWLVFRVLLPIYYCSELLSHTPVAEYIKWREIEIVHTFLLSSDLFIHWDLNRIVRYRSLYNSETPCSNPLARFGEERSNIASGVGIERGKALYDNYGCGGCHATDGSGGVGPSLKGISGKYAKLQNNASILRDREYLKRALTAPGSEVVEGYANTMPKFDELFDSSELREIVLYLERL